MGKGSKTYHFSRDWIREERTSNSFSLFRVLVFTSSLVACLASYYFYSWFMAYPEMPSVEMDKWWGPYPIDPEPDESIRPFQIQFDDVMVDDLRSRLLHTRPLTPPLEGAGFQYGFNTYFLTQILDFWKNKYNFREREEFFNRYDQYKTRIQGLDIHFMRVPPQVDTNVTVHPLLLVHGWPDSFRAYYDLVPLLTTPKGREGHQFVFELIVPSLPGFGFSQGASRPGLGRSQAAVILHLLMTRLGYSRYYLQGGDSFGVSSALATHFPEAVLGYHSHALTAQHRRLPFMAVLGYFWPNLVLERPELAERMYPLSKYLSYLIEESGYLHLQATKPDTIGAALTDSPAGLAAYILEKYSTWTSPQHRLAADGNLLKHWTLTQLLDNLMVYWTSGCITTALRMYAETYNARSLQVMMDEIPTPVPTACIKFKHSPVYTPDSILKLKYTNLVRSTAVQGGGHFATWEATDILAEDIFQAVNYFKEFHRRQRKLEPPARKQEKLKSQEPEPESQAPKQENQKPIAPKQEPNTLNQETLAPIQEPKASEQEKQELIAPKQEPNTLNQETLAPIQEPKASEQEKQELIAPKQEPNTAKQESLATKQEPNTPKQETQAPKQEPNTAKQETLAPKQEPNTPKQETLAPKQEPNTPKQETQAPKQEPNTPKQETLAPKQEPNTPKEQKLEKQESEEPKQQSEPTKGEPLTPNWETAKTIHEFTVKDIKGRDVKLDRYKGHVAVIVNVASHCGLTDNNYRQLNELYDKYSASKGLRILAFPCNQFGGQEPGSLEDIFNFTKQRGVKFDLFEKVEVNGLRILAFPCNQFGGQEPGSLEDIFNFTKQRGVKFDLFEKVEVNGANTHPLWRFLKRMQGGTLGDFIKWNFSKFIVDKNGVPVERLAPTVNPLDMEPYLAKYW